MYIYAGLFESMMACCGRIGFRHGPIYTLTMIALGLAVTLNLLSVIHLLWTLGVLDQSLPHRRRPAFPAVHPRNALYRPFLPNTVLARLIFSADQGRLPLIRVKRSTQFTLARLASSTAAAPVYVFASTSLFIVTLSISLR